MLPFTPCRGIHGPREVTLILIDMEFVVLFAGMAAFLLSRP